MDELFIDFERRADEILREELEKRREYFKEKFRRQKKRLIELDEELFRMEGIKSSCVNYVFGSLLR